MNWKDFNYVYLATDGNELKIGKTWNIRVRLARLKTQRKKHLKLIGFIPCKDGYSALKLESNFHCKVRSGNYRGDWHPIKNQTIADFLNFKGAVVCL